MIFISTGGFKNNTCSKTIDELIKNNIYDIELSGGKYEENQIEKLKLIKNSNKKINLQIHNYFPPPKNHFVFNLGSLDPYVSSLSMDHAFSSIKLASELGGKYYSFHGGFLLDPKVKELGKKIEKKSLYDRDKSKSLFIERVNKLSLFAKSRKITLLIENNVLSLKNYNEFSENILLMVDTNECVEIMKSVNKNVKMLIDVAHLKVSSNSLKFCKIDFLRKLDPWIEAYHLSDNQGQEDNNEGISSQSWFWPYLRRDLFYYSLEVYNVDTEELYKQRNLAMDMLYN